MNHIIFVGKNVEGKKKEREKTSRLRTEEGEKEGRIRRRSRQEKYNELVAALTTTAVQTVTASH